MIWIQRPSSFFASLIAAGSNGGIASCYRPTSRTSCVGFSVKTDTNTNSNCSSNSNSNYPFFTYTLGSTTNTLYVPFTSYCNTRTLPQLRGPNFRLPPMVVAALCRLRDAELVTVRIDKKPQYTFWCNWLDTQESYQLLPPPLQHSYSATIETTPGTPQHRPTVDELMSEVQQWYEETQHQQRLSSIPVSSLDDTEPMTVVISGEGEPTLRLSDLKCFIHQLRYFANTKSTTASYSSKIRLRIMTNGLLNTKQSHDLLQCCTSRIDTNENEMSDNNVVVLPITISVTLIASNAIKFNQIMEPLLPSSNDSNSNDNKNLEQQPYEMVIQFIRDVVMYQKIQQAQQQQQYASLLTLEVTAIEQPNIDKNALTQLVQSLGVTTPIRWRHYFD
jgi:wyosine [tRNA(Phe)-imidazoG37] synthetase (radical SAM superfamily)